MSSTVCILTAGRGSRMGGLSEHLNKALLPIDKRAIISQIIRRFPEGSEFVIGLGHLGSQVRDYLEMAHPKVRFQFVEIKNFDGPGSGPGFSLLTCKEHLQKPFYFVSCDTLWEGFLDFSLKEDWMGVAYVENTEAFCNFKIEQGRVTEAKDKVKVDPLKYRAFTGLCHIAHYEDFFQALESRDLTRGEHQISNGLKILIEKYRPVAVPMEWIDTGNAASYRAAVERYEDFDFGKENEALYAFDGRIVKFFVDPKIVENRVVRSRLNPKVFPKIEQTRSQFYSYTFVEGKTLYENCNPIIFRNLLNWLDTSLWTKVPFPNEAMSQVTKTFYQKKTNQRLQSYYQKLQIEDASSVINGVRVPKTSELFERIDWERILNGIPTFFHGDLQFDNILYNEKTDSFTLLDWRQDFAGQVEFGDIYYDLAKLWGGLILQYDTIKANFFSYSETRDGIFLDYVERYQSAKYRELLEGFIREKNLDLYKVRILVPLIYLNMAPLHHDPFDRFLYSLGRSLLNSELDRA